MLIDIEQLAQEKPSLVYHLMTQTIVPRPIAWVLTENQCDADAVNHDFVNKGDAVTLEQELGLEPSAYNLAPFSYFTPVSSKPAVVMVSIGKKSTAEVKDTARNIRDSQHCVIHIAQSAQLESLNESSREREYGDSELASASDLALESVEGFDLPKIKQASVALYCRLHQEVDLVDSSQALLFLRIEAMFIDDAILKNQDEIFGRIEVDANKFDAIARLGSSNYSIVDNVIDLKRPV